ncbi:uncharacterized protein B0I36DRAFT_365750 [Microdochium trichocladiopsis]|uniref:TPR domain-containing protein n=1 Tax=Microdochium trichocladiopsis TaxID=1682393 RepID=A0A9P9BMC5_9PEZI|nr:uncharacterized protein B0I36DRAFT_365750 [Microdochium trichocladiopsis]KAH7026143.1 hypothetical protein B0I36DRAFT_365750 [Microdochium trichocladiopsis]
MFAPGLRGAMRSSHGSLRLAQSATGMQPAFSDMFLATATRNRHATVIATLMRQAQVRWQSDSTNSKRPHQQPPPPKQKPLTKEEVFHVLKKGLDFRPLMRAFTGSGFRKLYRQSPEELVIALGLLAFISIGIVMLVYQYFTYFQSSQFTVFPDDVAQSLRRALYYTNYSPEPALAMKWYNKAIEQCKAHGIDPFHDEIMGIRIQIAQWLEGLHSYKGAIQVLEELFKACNGWMDKFEQMVRDGKVGKDGKLTVPLEEAALSPRMQKALEQAKEKAKDPDKPDTLLEKQLEYETLWRKRNRILAMMVKINTKLGDLYADPHVLENDLAGERLVWAVETTLKELHRRQTEGVKEGEGPWFTEEELGAELERLGQHYESKSYHYLAAPAFLQAITLSPKDSCHTAVIMNNLAISLAQQPIRPPINAQAAGSSPHAQPPTRQSLLASARQWALQAKATSEKVQGEARTEECDAACAVALCNLGTIASMGGDVMEARRWFQESLAMSKKLNFPEGVDQAQAGLDLLDRPSAQTTTTNR